MRYGWRAFLTRKGIAWAMYDWANSAFALSVLAVLFPLFNQSYWSDAAGPAAATARLAWITATAATIVCLTAPVLGTIADAGGYRKRFLFALAALGALATAALGLVGEGQWPYALALYLLASLGYYSSQVFYDSLLIDVTEPRYFGLVSTLGMSLGYLGGAFLLALHVWMLMSPQSFGLADANAVIRFAFVSVGVWWLLFLLPLIALVPEHRRPLQERIIASAFRQLWQTVSNVRRYRNIVRFLVAYWLYFGGVFSVIFLAVDYGKRLGFEQQDLVMALLLTNFIGFPATLAFGYLAHRVGPKTAISTTLLVYTGICVWAIYMSEVWQFYVMAMIVGCVQGAVQGLSRSFFASLIPAEQPGEFFGFYNMVTKFAHVVGPILVGLAASVSRDASNVILALLPLFVLGGWLLSRVSEPQQSAGSADAVRP